tara:strand:- start:485 stop:958 length:474 start_codon:yes stop_codon:yes gene_type:complete
MKTIINRLKQWYKIKLDGPPVPKYLSGKQTLKVKNMKTIICDIDGTLLNYLHDRPLSERGKTDHVALPGTVERMRQWEVDGCRIIIITGRRESERTRTIAELERVGIPYDMLLMGFADSGRVLINDVNSKGTVKAHAVSLPRDQGFNEYDWTQVGLK